MFDIVLLLLYASCIILTIYSVVGSVDLPEKVKQVMVGLIILVSVYLLSLFKVG
ncbi:hypothetical protein [Caudoviricetes sp.]|nr:hypothetical protein [Caudoviricetes sp.]